MAFAFASGVCTLRYRIFKDNYATLLGHSQQTLLFFENLFSTKYLFNPHTALVTPPVDASQTAHSVRPHYALLHHQSTLVRHHFCCIFARELPQALTASSYAFIQFLYNFSLYDAGVELPSIKPWKLSAVNLSLCLLSSQRYHFAFHYPYLEPHTCTPYSSCVIGNA